MRMVRFSERLRRSRFRSGGFKPSDTSRVFFAISSPASGPHTVQNSTVAGWEIPELNGVFNRKMIYKKWIQYFHGKNSMKQWLITF